MRLSTFASSTLAMFVGLTGCTGNHKPPRPPVPTPQSAGGVDQVINAVQMDNPSAPHDAQPTVPLVFQLVCYQITVPVGTVSKNETFWKRIDEQSLNPAMYDLVRRNGMRLGTAPVAEFENLRTLLQDSSTPAKVLGTIGVEVHNMEIPMRKDIPCQTVSYFGNENDPIGRSFDRCENIFNISFRRTPRKIGDMRLNLTPVVRSLRTHLEYTQMNNEIQIQDVVPTMFYLNLEADLPMDHFLVLAPSDTAELPTVIGHQFFVKDDSAQQMEQLLLFIAQPFRLDDARKTEGKSDGR